jgi:hypothetical protein
MRELYYIYSTKMSPGNCGDFSVWKRKLCRRLQAKIGPPMDRLLEAVMKDKEAECNTTGGESRMAVAA